MKLNHINLAVPDVGASRDFFAKYFGMTTTFERGRGMIAMMRDAGEMVLILSNFRKGEAIKYPSDFHVGFYLDSREEVDALQARMAADGLEVETPKKRAGRYGYYLEAPGGFTTEVAILDESAGDD